MPDRVGGYDVQGWVARTDAGGLCRARDEALDRVVALKHVARASSPAAERLRAEARMLAGLSHPHIVSVFDLVEDETGVWLVEEWVEGSDLRGLVARGRLSATQGIAVVHGALEGLAYTHERGVVHADITLRNILVDATGVSKLVDFGLARPRVVAAATETQPRETVLGTPGLVSPQVVAGQPATPADDVYSAGAVLASLLLGRALFAGSTAPEVLAAQRRGMPDLAAITPSVRSVLAKALAAEAADRYPDAGAFLAALDEAAKRDHGVAWLAEAGLAALVAGAGAGAATGAIHATLTSSTTTQTVGQTVTAQLKPVAVRTARRGLGQFSRTSLAGLTVAAVAVTAVTVVVTKARHDPPPPPTTSAVNAALPSATRAAATTPPAPSPMSFGPVGWADLRKLSDSLAVVYDLSCPTEDFCVASTEYAEGTVKVKTSTGRLTVKTVVGSRVSCVSPTFCLADGGASLRKWDGTSWKAVKSKVKGVNSSFLPSCSRSGFCATVGGRSMYTWDGDEWSTSSFPAATNSMHLSCVSAVFCAATTTSDSGVVRLYSWDGSRWSAGPKVTGGAGYSDGEVSCATEAFCMVIADRRSWSWNGSTWSSPHRTITTKERGASDVACPAVDFCELVTTGLGASDPGGQASWIVEGTGRTARWDGTAWSKLKKLDSSFAFPATISCPTTDLCVVGEVPVG